jgi:hypothetical protein
VLIKRIMLLLTVASVMAAMMVLAAPAAMALPPFASGVGPGGVPLLCDKAVGPGTHPAGALPTDEDGEPGIEKVTHLCRPF